MFCSPIVSYEYQSEKNVNFELISIHDIALISLAITSSYMYATFLLVGISVFPSLNFHNYSAIREKEVL